MKEEDLHKYFENVDDVVKGDINEMYKLLLTTFERHSGTLKECLNKYKPTQLEAMYALSEKNDSQSFEKLSKNEQVDYLEKNALDTVTNHLTSLTLSGLQDLLELMDNPDYILKNNMLQALGIVFRSIEDGKEKYYIPSDVEKILKEELTQDVILETTLNDIRIFLLASHAVYGLVPKDLLIKTITTKRPQIKDINKIIELLQEEYSIIKIDDKEYLWPANYPLPEKVKENITNPKDLSYDEILAYFMALIGYFDNLLETIHFKNTTIYKVLDIFVLSRKTTEELVEELTKEFNLKFKQTKSLQTFFEDFPSLRYWALGGRTIDEVELNHFILNKMPKDKTLEGCLNSLSKKALDILYNKYDAKDTEELGYQIFESIIDEDLTNEDKDLILDEQGKEYQDYIISPYDITHGYYYLYKENDKIKVFIPKEIEDMLNRRDANDEEIDGHDLIALYMLTNGILKKEKLQELLKQNHGIEYSIKELDREILDYQYFILDDYYSVLDELSNFEKIMIIKPKEGKEYKPVDIFTADFLDILNILSSEIHYYLENCQVDHDSKERFVGTIMILLQSGMFSKELIDEMMIDLDFKLDKSTYRKILSAIDRVKNDIPMWIYNGYTKREFNNRPKKVKIGRNDPCPCGSGKKYKKCCGKNA